MTSYSTKIIKRSRRFTSLLIWAAWFLSSLCPSSRRWSVRSTASAYDLRTAAHHTRRHTGTTGTAEFSIDTRHLRTLADSPWHSTAAAGTTHSHATIGHLPYNTIEIYKSWEIIVVLQFNYNVRTIRLAAQDEHWQQAQHCLPSMVLTLEQVHSLPAARQEQQEHLRRYYLQPGLR